MERTLRDDLEVVIVTGDKDLLQLVGPRVRVLSVIGRTGESVVYDEAKVRERWGVEPSQIVDVLALMGDSIDNIPGVRGVGEKTAVKLIGQYGSVARLYETSRSSPASCGRRWPPAGATRCCRGSWRCSHRRAVRVRSRAFRRREPDWVKLRGLWMEMEFARLIKELPSTAVAAPPPEAPSLATPDDVRAYLARVPAGAPLAGLGRHPPAAPAADLGARSVPSRRRCRVDAVDGDPPDLGDRPLIVHDAKPLIER